MIQLNALLPIRCLDCGEPVDLDNIFIYDEEIYCEPCARKIDPEFVAEVNDEPYEDD